MSGFRSGQGGGSPTDLKPRDTITVQGTNPKITIGDGGAEDTMLVFDGNAQDYRIGLDDGTDQLEIGHGSSHGTNIAIAVDSSGQVTKLSLAAAAVAVADDHIVILDGGATGAPKAESIQDLLSAIAGSGLSVSGNQLVASGGGAADSVAANDISTGNDAVNLVTTSGNITIDAQANDADVIIKVDDNGTSRTAVTFDGSDNAKAVFFSDISVPGSIELGHASDTTIARASSGVISVEGNNVIMASNDVSALADSTSAAIGIGTIELGHASDTTIARASSGVISVEGSNVIMASNDVSALTDSTSAAIGIGTIELGHASDTTIARASAGQITVEGTAVLLAGAQTGITTDFNASRKVGRDADNLIDFATTDNKLIFRVEGVNEVELVQNALSPGANDGTALGTTSLGWSDLFLAAEGAIKFGDDQDVTLTHVADTGLTLDGAGSATNLQITNSATDGDAAIQFALGGTVKYTMGVNDGDSDAFQINVGTGALGANTTALSIDSSGNVVLNNLTFDNFADDLAFGSSGANLLEYNKWSASASGGMTVKNSHASGAITLQAGDDSEVKIFSDKASAADTGAKLTLVTNDTAAMGNGHRLGSLQFAGHDGSHTGDPATDVIITGARIDALCDAAWSDTENGTSLVFLTTDGNASILPALTLNSDKLATFTGRIITDDDTQATSTTDGSLQTDGGLSVVKNAVIGGSAGVVGEVNVGPGNAQGVIASNGDQDLTLKTGNSDTSSITITDGANGNVTVLPDGTGLLMVDSESSQDAAIGFTVNTTHAWTIGADQSNSNAFTITEGGLIGRDGGSGAGSADFLIIEAESGVVLMPSGAEVGHGGAEGVLSSFGNQDLKLQTGNETATGNITLTDGSNGNITIAPHGTGDVVADGTLKANKGLNVVKAGTATVSCSSNSGGSTPGPSTVAIIGTATINERAGSITVNITGANGVIAASGGMAQMQVDCNEIANTDVVVASAINPHNGSGEVETFIDVGCGGINASGGNFHLMFKNHGGNAIPNGGGFTVNWAIV